MQKKRDCIGAEGTSHTGLQTDIVGNQVTRSHFEAQPSELHSKIKIPTFAISFGPL